MTKVAVTVRTVGGRQTGDQTVCELLIDVVKPKGADRYEARFADRPAVQAPTQLAAVLACAGEAVGVPWQSVTIEAAD